MFCGFTAAEMWLHSEIPWVTFLSLKLFLLLRFIFMFFKKIFMCMGVWLACIYVHYMYACGGQNRTTKIQELELKIIVSNKKVTGN